MDCVLGKRFIGVKGNKTFSLQNFWARDCPESFLPLPPILFQIYCDLAWIAPLGFGEAGPILRCDRMVAYILAGPGPGLIIPSFFSIFFILSFILISAYCMWGFKGEEDTAFP